MTTLPKEYLELLSQYGHDLKEIGVNGIALPRLAALKAVVILRHAGTPILGGDVCHVANGKIRVSYDNWYCKGAGDPGTEKYLEASLVQAENYIRAYSDPEDGTVFYQLVIGKVPKRSSQQF
jgi:hypothetical protein